MNRILFNNNSPTAFFYNGNVVNKIIFNGHEVYTKETPVPTPPNDEIWYTSSDGNIVTPYDASVFGANIVSNTYSEDKGIIKFDGDITSIGNRAFYNSLTLKSIEIPNSVTIIGDQAFYGCSALTSIEIPNSVTSISNYAFYGCTSLTSINIPSSVTSINNSAFQGCTSLTSINIPSSVTSIGSSAFNSCSSLESIEIPSSVTSISGGAFRNCSSLTSITINAITPPALVLNNVFLNTNDCPIYVPAESVYTYKAATNWSTYSLRIQAIQIPIPSNEIWYTSSDGNIVTPYDASVFGANIVSNTYSEGKGIIKFDGDITSIGLYAFRQRSSLTSVTIPNSVTSIGGSAFSGCSALTSVTIPNSVTSINNSAFCDCSSLESITVNATTPPSLGSGVFDNTNDCPIYVKIESVNSYKAATNWSDYAYRIQFEPIPIQTNEIWYTSSDGQKVTPYNTSAFGANISSNTYANGKGIIKFRGNVTSIGDNAFAACTTLASINIPSSVTNIGYSAFIMCRALTSINIPNSVTSIGDSAFNDCALTSINIPNSVTSIGQWAIGCSSLKLVTIPSSVTSIGEWAFFCQSLTKITVLNPTPASLGSGAFNYTNDCPIYVPAESVDAYKAATNWSTYAARIQAIPE